MNVIIYWHLGRSNSANFTWKNVFLKLNNHSYRQITKGEPYKYWRQDY